MSHIVTLDIMRQKCTSGPARNEPRTSGNYGEMVLTGGEATERIIRALIDMSEDDRSAFIMMLIKYYDLSPPMTRQSEQLPCGLLH